MKITHELGMAGFIETVRGKGGGMRLAVSPSSINLGAVVRAVEPDFVLVECFGRQNQCALTGYCRLAGVIGGALEHFLAHLDGHTLGDLVPDVVPPASTVLRRLPSTASGVGSRRVGAPSGAG